MSITIEFVCDDCGNSRTLFADSVGRQVRESLPLGWVDDDGDHFCEQCAGHTEAAESAGGEHGE